LTTVWITGASSGIGLETAKAFSEAGWNVVATSRNKPAIALENCLSFACDVTSPASITAAAKRILETYSAVDVLVNNAGVTRYKSFLDSTMSDYDAVMNTNLRGPFLVIKSVLPSMIKRKRGHIINILSTAAITVFENSSLYSASKAGLLAMGNVLRAEVRKHNIKVTNIYPGAVETAMWSPASLKKYRTKMMSPVDIARLVLSVAIQPEKVVVEDLVVRPMQGDI